MKIIKNCFAFMFFILAGCTGVSHYPDSWSQLKNENENGCPVIMGTFKNMGYLGPHKEVLPPYLDSDISLERIVIPSVVVNAEAIEITSLGGSYSFFHKTDKNVLFSRTWRVKNDFKCENGFLTFSDEISDSSTEHGTMKEEMIIGLSQLEDGSLAARINAIQAGRSLLLPFRGSQVFWYKFERIK
jgi:hypothetical protein